jgi:murein peptide amidase A
MTRWTIGRSVEGRAIEARAFGEGPTRALVHAGIHGDEPGAAAAAERLCARLEAERPAARVVVVPAVNPDGLSRGAKDNARGVDLNRNFAARSWGQAVEKPGYFGGTAALSEPESAALAALLEAERPARIVAIHQPFRCVNFDGPARALAEAMAAACGWPVVADVGYPTPGSFGSCYGIDRGLEVITLELPRPATGGDLDAALRALLVACV